ncbi:MAG: DoxX family protein [Lacibacter sp.]
MKSTLTIIRWFVGTLFIFSGLVKANDPLGLSYKMQEFFEAWGVQGFHHYTLALAVLMNAFEIIAGIALIVGWRMKLFSWLLLLLIVFFTFLTGYAWLATNPDGSPKFSGCGCFGDCLPLVPFQSFLKDILLLVLITVIIFFRKYIQPLFRSNKLNLIFIGLSFFFSFGFQWYTLTYLPVVDCLPFKKGNNILEMRKVPANAVPDKFDYVFTYEKNGKQQQFSMKNLPDSTWKFVERKQILLAKGKNNEAKIKDFDLKTEAGMDITEDVLQQLGTYYLLYVRSTDGLKPTDTWIQQASLLATKNKVIIITSVPDAAKALFATNASLSQSIFLSCDVTAIKTAARANPVLYKMEGAVVLDKWSSADFKHIK